MASGKAEKEMVRTAIEEMTNSLLMLEEEMADVKDAGGK